MSLSHWMVVCTIVTIAATAAVVAIVEGHSHSRSQYDDDDLVRQLQSDNISPLYSSMRARSSPSPSLFSIITAESQLVCQLFGHTSVFVVQPVIERCPCNQTRCRPA